MDSADLKIKLENEPQIERKDPTSFLPEEEMTYEIKQKKKKKKKRKRKQEDDPFKDIQEKVMITERIVVPEFETGTEVSLDPEVMIKVEDIECDVNLEDFTNNEDYKINPENSSAIHEPEVKIETGNHAAAMLTFEKFSNNELFDIKQEMTDIMEEYEPVPTHQCKFCHLIFKNKKTLRMHQTRKHKIIRRSFTHICDHCDMAYEFKSSLEVHIRRKHGPNSFVDNEEKICEICSYVFKGMARLRLHMRRKHGAFEESFKHVCHDCGLTYEKSSSLLVHRKRKHSKIGEDEEMYLVCPYCDKVYNKRETYARHMQRNHIKDDVQKKENEEFLKNPLNEVGEIACKECSLVFSSVTYLKLHMKRKHNALKENFKLKCRICNMSYDKMESLKRHVKRKHNEGAYCNTCNKQFNSRGEYLNHTHEKVVKECHLCGLIFASSGGLGKHLRYTHKIDSPKVAFCHICNQGFHDKRLLTPHLNKVHYKISYTCKFCKKEFKSKESYRKHVLTKHSSNSLVNKELHKCEQCTETFEDEFELCKHVNMVHRATENLSTTYRSFEKKLNINLDEIKFEEHNFQCIKCPEEFKTWDSLRSHFESTHYKANSCQCQSCGAIVIEKDLQKHMKQCHTVVEDLKCRFCDFKGENKVSLTQHILRHKDAKTINCDYPNCRYKTFYASAMEKHTQKHEDQGVKLQCSKCGFQSMNKYILKYHEEAHLTGKKRYECNQCDYATILPANLVQHKYKHSTEKRFKCEVCPFATKYNTSLRFHVKKKHCDLPT